MVAMVVDDEPVVHAYYPSSEADSSEKPDVRQGESVAAWVIRKQQPHLSAAPLERPGLVPSFAKALVYPAPLPDNVIGQDSFEGNGENRWKAVTSETLCWPYGIWLHGGKLAIADSGNNRVMMWAIRATAVPATGVDLVASA